MIANAKSNAVCAEPPIADPARVEGREAGEQRGADQQLQLRLQATRAEKALQPSCESPGHGNQHALENALTLDVAQQGRTFIDEQVGAQR